METFPGISNAFLLSCFSPSVHLLGQTNPGPPLPRPTDDMTLDPAHLFECHMTVQVWRGLCPGQPPISDPN